jgi:hypothetical protein
MVPIKNDTPSKFLDLINEPCLDEVDRTLIYAELWLKDKRVSK